jgi:hypothetical protein
MRPGEVSRLTSTAFVPTSPSQTSTREKGQGGACKSERKGAGGGGERVVAREESRERSKRKGKEEGRRR